MILKSRFRVDSGYSKSEDSNRVLREKAASQKVASFNGHRISLRSKVQTKDKVRPLLLACFCDHAAEEFGGRG